MTEAKITIAGRVLTERQSEVVRVAIDRWSHEEKIDVGSEDHARVLEMQDLIHRARDVSTESRRET